MAKIRYAKVNQRGEIILPPEVAGALGILPGDELRVEQIENAALLRSSVSTLRRICIEVALLQRWTCFPVISRFPAGFPSPPTPLPMGEGQG